MELKKGDRIFLRPKQERIRYSGEVLSTEKDGLLIEVTSDISEVKEGDSMVLIIERPDYYNEFDTTVISIESRNLRLLWQWSDRREFFRIDDMIAISARKIFPVEKKSSRITRGEIIELSEFDRPDPSINPKLWRLLNEINGKLNMILKILDKDYKDMVDYRYQKVNLSAGGIRFISDEPVSKGDIMEVMMKLNTCPPLNIITYGEVVRVNEKDSKYEVALSFKDAEDEIKEAILRYTLQRQREIIKKER